MAVNGHLRLSVKARMVRWCWMLLLLLNGGRLVGPRRDCSFSCTVAKCRVWWDSAREAILQNISHRFNLWINYCTSNKAAAQMTKHHPWRAGGACVGMAVYVLASFSRSTVFAS